jgi:glycosyltransferase involved in cell wall biosynthesis
MQLTVVLPTYNEAENLPRMVETLLGLELPGTDLRVLVVDDDSPDGTGRLADELAGRHPQRVSVLHRPGKEGLGRAYIAGFTRALEAGAELVLQAIVDLPEPDRPVNQMTAGRCPFWRARASWLTSRLCQWMFVARRSAKSISPIPTVWLVSRSIRMNAPRSRLSA